MEKNYFVHPWDWRPWHAEIPTYFYIRKELKNSAGRFQRDIETETKSTLWTDVQEAPSVYFNRSESAVLEEFKQYI